MNKNIKIYFLLLICNLVLFSCEKDQEAMLTQLKVVKEQFTPSYTSIAIECQLHTSASINDVYVQYATSQDFADYQEEEMQHMNGRYTADLFDLEDNTTYYIRYAASNRYSTGTTKKNSTATTLTQSIPTINLISVTDIWDKTAMAQIELINEGGADVTQQGVCWSTKKNPTLDNGSHMESSKNPKSPITISNLQINTTYYVRAYAVNRKGVAYSKQELTFTTLSPPEVLTNEITDIQLTTATLHGKLTFNGNDSATIKGFCWSEQTAPTINSNQIQVTTSSTDFVYQLSDLKDETMYYVRAYAKNKIGITYGEEKFFTTTSAIKPTVTTSSITGITYTSAQTGGNVTSDGGATVTDRGICYSTSSNPTISNNKVCSGSGTSSFTANLTGLLDGTTYYVRAYATNKKGTTYGEQKSFTTNAYLKPIVTTSSATNISYTSATIGGNVTSDGGATVTERGIVYSTSQNPTTSNSKKVSSSGTGTFSLNLTGLTNGTTYYARAYAINSKGTSYGQQITFATQAYSTPTVTTNSVNDITNLTAIVSGNVTSNGGTTVTERGVVYSTSQNPTTSNSKVISGSGVGTFSANLSNLQEGVTYYARAYAINSKGTNYGSQLSFTTKIYFVPTVTTSAASNVTYTSAMISGNVTSDGSTNVTERGVVYNTSQNPTTSSSKIISGTGIGTFSVCLSGLTDGTTYYTRAYAINSKGTSYGEQINFTTKSYIPPTLTTSAANNITYTSATISNNVVCDADVEITERGVCYSRYKNPTIESSKIVSGSGNGSFIVDLNNLTHSTTYYVRSYAIYQKGLVYGNEISFTTKTKTFIDGYEYVDLGLSSGVKWAVHNIGATLQEDFGDYYSWGETAPYDGGYKFYTTYYHTFVNKYNTNDYLVVLEPEDDAAMVNWGGVWRMPTKVEQEELMTECTWDQTSINNVTGCLVTGPNGNSIFLPMAKSKGKDTDDTYISGYWSSSLYTSNTMLAYCMSIWTNGPQFWDCKRHMGCPIRPVCP